MFAVAFLLFFPINQVEGKQLTRDYQTLQHAGYEPTNAGAKKYLQSLEPSHERQTSIAKLIEKLGDDDYATREDATRKLLNAYASAEAKLRQTLLSTKDPEIEWRARRIIQTGFSQLESNMAAALRIAIAHPDAFAVKDILAIEHLLHYQAVRFLGKKAIRATARKDDIEILLKATNSKHEIVRREAAAAIVNLLHEENLSQTHHFLEHDDETLAIITAHALLNRGDRVALAALVEKLESNNPVIRTTAVTLLRGATGKDFGFPTGEATPESEATIANWRNWVDENNDIEIRTPVPLVQSGRGDLGGNTLITTGRKGIVREFDSRGETVWELKIDSWCAERLPDGTTLVCSHKEKKLLVVNEKGETIWEYKGPASMVAEPLPSGHFLVADFYGKRVFEINRKKEIVWEFKAPDKCFDVDRRRNGNTIVACPNEIVEVAPDKTVVNKWKVKGRLNGLQILPNGNFLIANYGDNVVYEMDSKGERIWSFEVAGPCDAFRQLTGETLITTKTKLFELREDRATLAEIGDASYGSVRK